MSFPAASEQSLPVDPSDASGPSEPSGQAGASGLADTLGRLPWRRLAGAAGLLGADGDLRSTVFEEMSALAARHGAVNLGQGFPDTDGPEVLAQALGEAVAAGRNQYATIAGLPDLRREIAAHEELDGRRRPDPESEVTVTAGATEALAAAMLAFLRPGDEVVLLEPCYDLYPAVAALAGATVVRVPLVPPAFLPTPGALAAAFSSRTAMVVLNDPHNPTGTVFSEDVVRELVGLAEQHDALVLTDSVYEHLYYGPRPVDPAALPGGAERTIRVSAASKTFSVTGWRVGWAIAPLELTRGLRATKGYLSHSAAAPLQAAVAAAMAWAREGTFYEDLRAAYRHQRSELLEGLAGLEWEVPEPAGTFFAVARLPQPEAGPGASRPAGAADGEAFAAELPERAGVAVVPLTAFTGEENREAYRPWIRLAFCKRPEVLRQAVRRLQSAGSAGSAGSADQTAVSP